ncbi:hypothetical protein DFH09DRAFT_1187817 [Mycena vulgaris]|nr:hypothetical protein DFH09DRAFT_1187817 [Mycena vulgaris]
MQFKSRAEKSTEQDSGPGHLNASWEIAVAIALLVLLGGIIGTVVWHTRRTRRRRWHARLIDAEAAAAAREKTPSPPPLPSSSELSRDVPLVKPPPVAVVSTQSLKTSFDSESKRPPRYYWDHRRPPP